MHRRRLVHPSGDGLEVVHTERVRVQAAVPADDVERMRGVHVAGPGDSARAPVPDENLDVGTVDGELPVRTVQVALAVRRVLQQLPEPRQVALGRGDVGVGLDDVQPHRIRSGRDPAVRRAARQQHVVACVACRTRTPSRRSRCRSPRTRTRHRPRCGRGARPPPPRPRRRSGRALPRTSLRPVTASTAFQSADVRSCSLRCRGSSGRFSVSVWSGRSQGGVASTIADGTPPEW